jgi:hypothetical protein
MTASKAGPSPGGEWHFDGNVGQPEKEGILALIEQWKKASRNSATR